MTSLPPVSPPAVSPTTLPPSDAPVSPVSRSGTFTHKTSPAVSSQTPLIDTNTPAINAAPVEIDGSAVSHDDLKRRPTGGSGSGIFSPADEDDIDAEFLSDGTVAGREAREKRAAMLANRSKDPGVIVDVPQDPTAEEVEAAKSADGVTTPGLDAERISAGLGGR